ncbi:MAG: hypothetical protein NVS1B11_30620 [Terriglobales bacterium]
MEERRPLPSVQAMAKAPLYPVEETGAKVIVHVFVAWGAKVKGSFQPFTAKLAPFTTACVMVTLVLPELVKDSERTRTLATGTLSKWIAEGVETRLLEFKTCAVANCSKERNNKTENRLRQGTWRVMRLTKISRRQEKSLRRRAIDQFCL